MLSSKSNSGNMCDTMWSPVRQVWYNIKTANSGSIQTMPTQQIGSETLVNQVWHNSKTETHLASPSPPALHTKTTSCYLSQIQWRGLDEQNQIDRRTKNIWCPVDFLWNKHQNQTSEPNNNAGAHIMISPPQRREEEGWSHIQGSFASDHNCCWKPRSHHIARQTTTSNGLRGKWVCWGSG